MNIASSVVKISSVNGVNTFVRPKQSTSPISPVQGVKMVEGFHGKMPTSNLKFQEEDLAKGQNETLGRYVDVYA